jgi:hypothetical protein
VIVAKKGAPTGPFYEGAYGSFALMRSTTLPMRPGGNTAMAAYRA